MEKQSSTTLDGSQKSNKPKQFRKGTKSCIECRQRKLRCIPSSDESQPCQNCAAKGRECVLQVHAGRNAERQSSTTRDRIRQLENSVGRLWSVVKDLREELGHTTQTDSKRSYDQQMEDQIRDENDSDTSDMSPFNQPSHLQQLFDNDLLDTQGSGYTPESNFSKSWSVQRARSRLQPLIPSKEDVRVIGPVTEAWLKLYNTLFPAFTLFRTLDEILLQYDGLLDTDANPTNIAALLLWMAIGMESAPSSLLDERTTLSKDVPRFVRQVSEAIEETVVKDDTVAASIEGIEVSMLWLRLQLLRTNSRKPWIALRRCIALAELIGLPRAARVVNSTPNASLVCDTRQQTAAAVWESLCIVDRLAGLIFALPLGTTRHGLPRPQEVVDSNGQVIVKAYLAHIGRIAGAIQDVDDISFSQLPEIELFERVLKVDQDLNSLRAMTPESWWALGPDCAVADHLMQFWHTYITIRAHLQLALKNTRASQYAYSYVTCTQACRELAARYVKLRAIVPPTFFAARLIDCEALTAAVFLIYISHTSTSQQGINVTGAGDQSHRQLAFDCVRTMESTLSHAPRNIGLDAARNGSKAIRALDELLGQPDQSQSQTLSLKIPMLGKINVGRRFSSVSQQNPQTDPSLFAPSSQKFELSGGVAMDPSAWSMDLLMDEDFQLPPDSYPDIDQWFTFTSR